MKAIVKAALVLVGCASFDPALAQPFKASSEDLGVAKIIEQLERDWVAAEIAVDIDGLNTIMADDWTYSYSGKTKTKASFLADLKSGKSKLEACEFGPMDVQVSGNVAVAQGRATVTVSGGGQSSIFQLEYRDVFEKRGDKWMVVRTQTKKL